jgi:hypothetical protein
LCLLTDDNNDNPIIIRPHIVFTDGQQRQPNHNTTTYCGRIVIGLSLLLSVSRHNMWSYIDWVYYCCRSSVNTICGDNNNKPNHYTTTYCVYWQTKTTINPIIIRPHIVFTDGQQQRQPNHNTTTYCVYWRTTTQSTQYVVVLWLGLLLLSSVSKHNMWSYYDWVYCCCPSVT